MLFIQRKDGSDLETVDEFPTRKEARKALTEYQLSDKSAVYYISSRACRHWRTKEYIVPCVDISLRDYKAHCYVMVTGQPSYRKCRGHKLVEHLCKACPLFVN